MGNIRVLIVGMDPGLNEILQVHLLKKEEIEIVGYAETREEAIQLSTLIEHIDVFLIGFSSKSDWSEGLYTAVELKRINSDWKIITLSSINDEIIIKKTFAAGVSNYLLMGNISNLPNIISQTYYEKSPIEILVEDYCRLKQEEQLKELTPAELEIYKLVEQGLTRTEMERKLLKTENTLKCQIKTMLKKLCASSTKEAVIKVKSCGIL